MDISATFQWDVVGSLGFCYNIAVVQYDCNQ